MSVWTSIWGSENSQVPPASHANPASQETISFAQAGRRTRVTVCRSIDPISLHLNVAGAGATPEQSGRTYGMCRLPYNTGSELTASGRQPARQCYGPDWNRV